MPALGILDIFLNNVQSRGNGSVKDYKSMVQGNKNDESRGTRQLRILTQTHIPQKISIRMTKGSLEILAN
jgi:hypothetical protein